MGLRKREVSSHLFRNEFKLRNFLFRDKSPIITSKVKQIFPRKVVALFCLFKNVNLICHEVSELSNYPSFCKSVLENNAYKLRLLEQLIFNVSFCC